MLTLFHSPKSRSSRFIWLLEELGADYRLVFCDIRRRDGTGAPDQANPHPDRRVPALLHDEVLVTESSAIALYLTDLYPQSGLGPAQEDPLRGAYLTWLAYSAGEIEASFSSKISGYVDKDPGAAHSYDRVIERVFSALDGGPYILGDHFTAVDVLVASPFQWYRGFAPANPALDAWLERLSVRPALITATQKDLPRQKSAESVTQKTTSCLQSSS